MEMFEKAARWKLRFNTPRGKVTAEDLWDIPLTSNKAGVANLNDLAKTLNKELKADEEEDFVSPKLEPNKELMTSFEIVKHVIEVRVREQEAVKKAKETKEKKAQILAILADKEMESLKGKSVEDLRALLESM